MYFYGVHQLYATVSHKPSLMYKYFFVSDAVPWMSCADNLKHSMLTQARRVGRSVLSFSLLQRLAV